MTRAPFNYERAAQILADAEVSGDRAAALSWNVCTKTVERYRSRLKFDEQLSESVRKLRDLRQQSWGDKIPTAIASGLEFLHSSFKQASRTDPEAIAAVTAAVEMLCDVELTRRAIDERLKQVKGEPS